jgi:hypothetical protein
MSSLSVQSTLPAIYMTQKEYNKALKALAMLAGTSASCACSGPLAQRYV